MAYAISFPITSAVFMRDSDQHTFNSPRVRESEMAEAREDIAVMTNDDLAI